MNSITEYPFIVFVVSFVVLWLSTQLGAGVLKRWRKLEQDAREDFGVILAAKLTLLGLIIGFRFSMATGRYDQRKNLEEEEANAIGTFFLIADIDSPRHGIILLSPQNLVSLAESLRAH